MNNLQVLLARIGRPRKRRNARTLLIESAELPGVGWEMAGDSAWRTGAWGFKPSDAGQRAHQLGVFSAARGFTQKGADRTLWVEVMTLACEEDANGMVPILRDHLLVNPNSPVTLSAERKVQGHELPGPTYPWVYEQLTEGAIGGASVTRFVGGSTDRIVFLVACSGYEGNWPWDEVLAIASLQGEKIGRVLDSSPLT
jgi:hypothetical protein